MRKVRSPPVLKDGVSDLNSRMNAEAGFQPMVLDPETHADINFGNLSFTENYIAI